MTAVTDVLTNLGYRLNPQLRRDSMAGQFTPETAIFETIQAKGVATPRFCGVCNVNPPTFAYRFGQFTNGSRTGHCCTPCACKALMEMAERGVTGGLHKHNASRQKAQ